MAKTVRFVIPLILLLALSRFARAESSILPPVSVYDQPGPYDANGNYLRDKTSSAAPKSTKPPPPPIDSSTDNRCAWALINDKEPTKGMSCQCKNVDPPVKDPVVFKWGAGQKCGGKTWQPTDNCKTQAIQATYNGNPNWNRFLGCYCESGPPYPEGTTQGMYIFQKYDTGEGRKCKGSRIGLPMCYTWTHDTTGAIWSPLLFALFGDVENAWQKCDCDHTEGFTGEMSQYNPCYKRP